MDAKLTLEVGDLWEKFGILLQACLPPGSEALVENVPSVDYSLCPNAGNLLYIYLGAKKALTRPESCGQLESKGSEMTRQEWISAGLISYKTNVIKTFW